MFLAVIVFVLNGAVHASETEQKLIRRIGQLQHAQLRESSGIVASRRYEGVCWTHNDSGNPSVLYAIRRDGTSIAEFPLDIPNRDWEDIAADETGHLYIGDIGNNRRVQRPAIVYRIEEPNPRAGITTSLRPSARWELHYPGEPFDCESLIIHNGWGYLVSKVDPGPASIYRFSLDRRMPVLLEEIASLPNLPPVTGADISPDGRQIVLIANTGVFVFPNDSNMTGLTNVTPLSVRYVLPAVEACGFVEDGVLATSEYRGVFLFSTETLNRGGSEYPPPVELNIQRVGKRPKIDGRLKKDWDLDTGELLMKSTSPETKSARTWARWANNGLYLAAIVPDDRVSPLSDPWYRGDTIEVFVGRHAANRSPDYEVGDNRCYLGFARKRDGSCGKLEVHWPRRSPPADVKVAGRIKSKGTYRVEMFIPRSVTEGELGSKNSWEVGSQIRLNVSILSREPRRDWYISSPNSVTFRSPMTWAIATLVKSDE